MPKNSKSSFKKHWKNNFWFFTLAIIISLGLLRAFLVAPYNLKPDSDSPYANALFFFTVNRSVFADPAAHCWYDSGDYLIFSHRQALTVWYLSIAYRETDDQDLKNDLSVMINEQLACADDLLAANLKQIRDQNNHGINLPPVLHRWFYPNETYSYGPGEGQDVRALLTLAAENIGDVSRAANYRKKLEPITTLTTSEQCCEQGPLRFPAEWATALNLLTETTAGTYPGPLWGLQPTALAALEHGDPATVAGVLEYVENNFEENGVPFDYLGGNYDIAGTIALERLYARQTGSEQYAALSERLNDYLHGNNEYQTDFTYFSTPYHPCAFFRACTLSDALVNGVDASHTVTPEQTPWNVAEIQSYGQAIYLLSQVLLAESE